MGKRHNTIGIKQAIRYEWMQKAVNLLLSGLSQKEIRTELHEYLGNRFGSGILGARSNEASSFAVTILMKTWITPDPILLPLHDALIDVIHQGGNVEKAAHWVMICASYPFWFNVARQTGRILALQDQVTMKQITSRMKEQYGDRQTVSRNVQFVVRSFAYWGVLDDTDAKGCYKKSAIESISDLNFTILMFEGALQALPEGKETLDLLLNNPAFFPYNLPLITGDFISQHNHRIDVVRYGLEDELLMLKNK